MYNFKEYYKRYWSKRGASKNAISKGVPVFLHKYTYYGAISDSLKSNSKILDIGSGDGSVSKLYMKSGSVTGIEISESAIKMAKKRGLQVIEHDLNSLPFPIKSNTFDYVIATDVIEHLIDPLSTLKEINRLLKKGGKIIISVPNFARLANRVRMVFGDPIDILHWDKYGDEVEHLHWFTKPKLEHLFNKANFKDLRFLPAGLKGNFLFVKAGLPGLTSFLVVEASKK